MFHKLSYHLDTNVIGISDHCLQTTHDLVTLTFNLLDSKSIGLFLEIVKARDLLQKPKEIYSFYKF